MNWFLISAGVLMAGAMMEAIYSGNFKLAIISLCYSIANFVLAGVK